jgi:putative ABC transport system substrate-binding protein
VRVCSGLAARIKVPCQRVLAGTPRPSAISSAKDKGSQGATGNLLLKTAGACWHFLDIVVLSASVGSWAREIDAVIGALVEKRAGALVIFPDALFTSRIDQLAALTTDHLLPAIYNARAIAQRGGLTSYGADQADAYRQAGIYAGRIPKGAKPADLPVQQSTKVELVVNLKTATALGVKFPLTLLGRADEVIE